MNLEELHLNSIKEAKAKYKELEIEYRKIEKKISAVIILNFSCNALFWLGTLLGRITDIEAISNIVLPFAYAGIINFPTMLNFINKKSKNIKEREIVREFLDKYIDENAKIK